MTLGAIFNADLYCAACAGEIKDDICEDLFNRRGSNNLLGLALYAEYSNATELREFLDSLDQSAYDSSEYPKDCDVSGEADGPAHCGGCSGFLENDLTTYGIDYVKEAVRDDIRDGRADSIALTVWMPYYSWVDFGELGECDVCGRWSEELDCNGECEDCAYHDEEE